MQAIAKLHQQFVLHYLGSTAEDDTNVKVLVIAQHENNGVLSTVKPDSMVNISVFTQ